jgi:aerotaxis receptor
MRTNLPVIDHEYPVEAGVSIVSKTDLNGMITYANQAFVDISGYSRQELMGQPHNLLRHPDMPAQAFEHMWKTLKAGNPWKGIVKNRTKDGGFYWVKATVVPVRKHNQTIGYMSVREKATVQEIESARALYTKINKTGEPIRENRLSRFMTIRSGFFMGSFFVIFLLLAGGALGIGGLWLSNHSANTLLHAHIEPLGRLGELESSLHRLQTGLHTVPSEAVPFDGLEDDRAAVRVHLRALHETECTPEQEQLKDRIFEAHRALEEGFSVMNLNSMAERTRIWGTINLMQKQIAVLREGVLRTAYQDHAQMLERNALIWKIALAGLVFGILVVIGVGRFFVKEILTPLNTAIAHFDQMAQGDLGADVEVYGKGETGHLSRASAIMQMHLKVITDEIYLVAGGIREHCSALNMALFEIADHSETQHDTLSEARTVLFEAQSFSESLHALVEELSTEVATGNSDALKALAARLENTVRLHAFALEDFLNRIEGIAELVVNNRQDTQSAYGLSGQLQQASDELYNLIAYFSSSSPVSRRGT